MFKTTHDIHLYHGTSSLFDIPRLSFCNSGKDFGKGFYLTTDKGQAVKFAKTIANRNGSSVAYVNEYIMPDFDGLSFHVFDTTNEDWLNCVIGNRSKKYFKLAGPWISFDAIAGKIADDDTSQVINAYISGAYGPVGSDRAVSFAIEMFIPNRLKDQLCLRTQAAIDKLVYVKREVVSL